MLEPETFLPLDYIQAKPLKERLRNITSVRGVKLLYDVLNYNPPDIKRAVLFVTNNSLVCETPEDAMKVSSILPSLQVAVVLFMYGTVYSSKNNVSNVFKFQNRYLDRIVVNLVSFRHSFSISRTNSL